MNEDIPTIRRMFLKDVGKCLLLSSAEGWNQTENDWNRFVANPENMCMVMIREGQIIATGTVMNYANKVAWIGMVLVEKSWRGKGFSKILLSYLLDHLKSFRTVKLDATPAGQPLYKKFGFQDEYTICRFIIPAVGVFQPSEKGIMPTPMKYSDIPEVSALDEATFGSNRKDLFSSLISNDPDKAWLIKRTGRIVSYALGRKGKYYQYIGPIFAANIEDAKILISHTLRNLKGQSLVIDIPEDKIELIHWLEFIGITIQRRFIRMYLHSNLLLGNISNQFSICGPEYG